MRIPWYPVTVAMIGAVALLSGAVGTSDSVVHPARKETPAAALPEAVVKLTKPIFDGKTLEGWIQIPADSWEVKDGAMASKGAGRGVIYTKDDYSKCRLVFTMRHVSGKPDHRPAC